MNILTASQVCAAVDAAVASTLALEKPVRVATAPLSDNCTIRTDVYVGPKGSGFIVTATLDLGYCTIMTCKQHGPETWRERPFPNSATLLGMLQKGLDAKVALGFSDPVTGITLALTSEDRAAFDALYNHLQRKATPDDEVITIAALDRTPHNITFAGFHALLVRAGDYYSGLWGNKLQQEILAKS